MSGRIRIKYDVLIWEDDNRVLSSACPRTAEEIEALMKLEGLGGYSDGKLSSGK